MPAYNKEIYSQLFARLLDRAITKGGGNPRAAQRWLERRYKLPLALLFARHKLELTDAYMDVREHIRKRVEQMELGELQKEN